MIAVTDQRPAIRAEGLTKFYGDVRGIENLDLEVRRGELFGFLGPNGAGKTTTIRLLLDLLRPTRGRVEVLGVDPSSSVELRRSLGYLPGELALYEELTGIRSIEFFASLRDVSDLSYAHELAERLALDLDRPIRSLSKGNKQKVGLVLAFFHRPDLLILDEPTSGLDPLVQHEFQKILAETASEGRTVFLSSHVLSEIEHVSHRVGIIRAGALVVVEEIAGLKAKATRRLDIHLASAIDEAEITGIPGVKDVTTDDRRVSLTVEGSMDRLIKSLARYEVLDLISEEPDLDEIFLTYYEDEG
jgi:ABC-2 type transport system ATP-binding protein